MSWSLKFYLSNNYICFYLYLPLATDKVAQAKTCLLRLTGSFDGFDNEEDKFDDEMLDHANGEDEGNGLAEPCDNSVHTDGLSPNEKAKVEEILKDLETVPADMTVSSEVSISLLLSTISLCGLLHCMTLNFVFVAIQRNGKRSYSALRNYSLKRLF